MVRGNENIPSDQTAKVCVQNSKWSKNERIVWRIKVLDPKTGVYLDDTNVGQVEVKLSDGQVFQTKYGGHGGTKEAPLDKFWAVGWTIPENYPSGTMNFAVNVVAKDGRQGQLLDFKVPAAFLTVLDAKVPIIKK